MAGHRKAAEEFILKYIDAILPGSPNKELYILKFSKMSDDEFEAMIQGFEDDSIEMAIISPNFSTPKLDVERNLNLATELGHNFFQKIRVPAKDGLPAYLTPIPYLVIDLPNRRQSQLLDKKISIPEDNNSVDDFTGQPTGKSKGSKITYPEVQVMAALGLTDSLTEFLKYRGGDEKGFNAMNTSISRTGRVSQRAIAPYASGVKVTATLKAYLAAMMLQTTGL